ncbi:MAG: efflux RND transporter periplasmic adaptor subunit [Candidatus Aminicenantaceae bacterium]
MVFSKKTLTIVLILIVLGAAAYYVFVIKGVDMKSEAGEGESEPEQQATETPLPVKVGEVKRGDLIIRLKSPGEAVTNMYVDMKAEVSGKVNRILVKESQKVKKGQVLLELDDREARLSLENSEAIRLERLSKYILEQQFAGGVQAGTEPDQAGQTLTKKLEEISDLYQKGMISQEDFERRSRQLEIDIIKSGAKKEEIMEVSQGLTQAEIQVKQARLALEKTKVLAPFSGVITNIQISPGQNVSGGTDLFTLVNIDRVQVHAKVLESEIGKMKVGREVDLKFSAYPGQVFKGRVQAISPIVDPADKTCNVIVEMVNVDQAVKPGMHAEVEIAAEIYTDRLLVPQDAILTRNQRKLVFVVEDDRAKWKYIAIGLENEEFAEVLPTDDPGGGIEAGNQVLIDGHFTIAHDARIRIVQ